MDGLNSFSLKSVKSLRKLREKKTKEENHVFLKKPHGKNQKIRKKGSESHPCKFWGLQIVPGPKSNAYTNGETRTNFNGDMGF